MRVMVRPHHDLAFRNVGPACKQADSAASANLVALGYPIGRPVSAKADGLGALGKPVPDSCRS
jgi:hypothetical protein